MASPGTMSTYDQVGKKEEISNIITNLSPTKTPFTSMTGTEGIDGINPQWQEDSLLAVTAPAAVEGADAGAASWQATVMRSNTTQILSTVAQASGTADRVKKYGRDRELSYQLGLRSAELKRNLENVMVGVGVGQVAVAGTNSTARQMAGVQVQISTSTNVAGALTETAILNSAQTCYVNGAEPSIVMVKPADAKVIAGFMSNGRTNFVENDAKKVYNVVDVYESPFGALKVVINRFLKSTDALIFEPDMWKRLVLRNWFRETLAKTGDSTKVMILGEFSLKHRNYAASALLTGLT